MSLMYVPSLYMPLYYPMLELLLHKCNKQLYFIVAGILASDGLGQRWPAGSSLAGKSLIMPSLIIFSCTKSFYDKKKNPVVLFFSKLMWNMPNLPTCP